MTESELISRVDSIIAQSDDDERAHGMEDELHLEIIKAYCPAWVIAEIERLSAADFTRHCA